MQHNVEDGPGLMGTPGGDIHAALDALAAPDLYPMQDPTQDAASCMIFIALGAVGFFQCQDAPDAASEGDQEYGEA